MGDKHGFKGGTMITKSKLWFNCKHCQKTFSRKYEGKEWKNRKKCPHCQEKDYYSTAEGAEEKKSLSTNVTHTLDENPQIEEEENIPSQESNDTNSEKQESNSSSSPSLISFDNVEVGFENESHDDLNEEDDNILKKIIEEANEEVVQEVSNDEKKKKRGAVKPKKPSLQPNQDMGFDSSTMAMIYRGGYDAIHKFTKEDHWEVDTKETNLQGKVTADVVNRRLNTANADVWVLIGVVGIPLLIRTGISLSRYLARKKAEQKIEELQKKAKTIIEDAKPEEVIEKKIAEKNTLQKAYRLGGA